MTNDNYWRGVLMGAAGMFLGLFALAQVWAWAGWTAGDGENFIDANSYERTICQGNTLQVEYQDANSIGLLCTNIKED